MSHLTTASIKHLQPTNVYVDVNKDEVINQLTIWVYGKYSDTPQCERAERYLDLCKDKINRKTLIGSIREIVNKFKGEIAHALERDQLTQEVASLQFESYLTDSIASSKSADLDLIQKREKEEVEHMALCLEWERSLRDLILSADKDTQPSIGQIRTMQEQVDNILKDVQALAREREKERSSLQRTVEQGKVSNRQKKAALLAKEKEVYRVLKETSAQEKQLQKHRSSCLQQIKLLQGKIDTDIQGIQAEPKRLSTELNDQDHKFLTAIAKILSDSNKELESVAKVKELEAEGRIKEFAAAHAREMEDFRLRNNSIQNTYQRLITEDNEEYQRRYKKIFDKFNAEVILNRGHFIDRWNSSLGHVGAGDINGVVRRLHDQRNNELNDVAMRFLGAIHAEPGRVRSIRCQQYNGNLADYNETIKKVGEKRGEFQRQRDSQYETVTRTLRNLMGAMK